MAFGVTPHNLATSRMLAATDVPNRATCRLEEKEAEEEIFAATNGGGG